MLWSDCVDAQADPSLCWAHTHILGIALPQFKNLIGSFEGFISFNDLQLFGRSFITFLLFTSYMTFV